MQEFSFWIQPDQILECIAWLFGGVQSFLLGLFGVGNPDVRILGEGLYVFDIILAVMLASVLLFIHTFRQKFNEVDEARKKSIDSMYIRETKQVERNKKWESISYMIRTPNPNDWKIAIIEADAMLDDLFIRLGYPGESLGDRMKSVNKAQFPAIDDAWEAHKVRNMIAHQDGYKLDQREALRVYYLYEKVFTDAGLL